MSSRCGSPGPAARQRPGTATGARSTSSQDATDSTLWTGTLTLPAGQPLGDVRFLVQAANGVGAVGLDTADGDGYGVTAEPDVPLTADSTLAHARHAESPLGVSATVTDRRRRRPRGPDRELHGLPQGNGALLLRRHLRRYRVGRPAASCRSDVPAGVLTVTASDLVRRRDGTVVRLPDQTEVPGHLQLSVVSVAPTPLLGRAGSGVRAPGWSRTVTDGGVRRSRGSDVRFRFPTTPLRTRRSSASLRLTTRPSSLTAQGVATSPRVMAGAVIGPFDATVSAPGAASVTVPMASQYGLTAFGSPANESKTNNLSPTNTLPMKTSALLADGTKLSDAAAAALVQSGQVQVRWREVGTTTWFTKAGLVVYDASKDLFQPT